MNTNKARYFLETCDNDDGSTLGLCYKGCPKMRIDIIDVGENTEGIIYAGDSSFLSGEWIPLANCSVCEIDEDEDCVCDDEDLCLDSMKGEPVDKDGCDAFQFCSRFYCGNSCHSADFVPVFKDCKKVDGREESNPMDCVSVIVKKEGTLEPRCTPTTCAD
jgi:hypothetical protein